MSNLKDTDFDDLFRRASEKYPLRTDSSDWEKMAAALEKDPTPDPDDSVETGNRRKRRVLWLFLLLPLAGIGYLTMHSGRNTGHTGTPSIVAKSSTVTPATGTNPATVTPSADNNSGTTPAVATPSTGKSIAQNPPVDNSSNSKKGATPTKPATTATPATAATTPGATATTTSTTPPAATVVPATGPTTATTHNQPASTAGQAGAGVPHKAPRMVNSNDPKSQTRIIHRAGGDIPVRPKPIPARPEPATATANTRANNRANGASNRAGHGAQTSATGAVGADNAIDPTTNPIAASFTLKHSNIDAQRARFDAAYSLVVNVKTPETPEIKKDSTKPKTKKKQYLYAGIIAAPDLSVVKFQQTKGVGNTFGILLGYAFNDHWAIETGAYVDRKRYYTDGEYFSTKNVKVPNGANIRNVDGTCYMWEIPINVRYNFNPAGKTKWFATAGFSTYLMNRENYTYNYNYWGGTRTWDSTWNIKKNSQYPFSIVGLSVGFEQRLGKLGNLRVEPYVRLPLGGIGTGSLPIMSTGINIGITKRLW